MSHSSSVSSSSSTSTLLELCQSEKLSWDLLLQRIKTHPEEAMWRDAATGMNVLHYIALKRNMTRGHVKRMKLVRTILKVNAAYQQQQQQSASSSPSQQSSSSRSMLYEQCYTYGFTPLAYACCAQSDDDKTLKRDADLVAVLMSKSTFTAFRGTSNSINNNSISAAVPTSLTSSIGTRSQQQQQQQQQEQQQQQSGMDLMLITANDGHNPLHLHIMSITRIKASAQMHGLRLQQDDNDGNGAAAAGDLLRPPRSKWNRRRLGIDYSNHGMEGVDPPRDDNEEECESALSVSSTAVLKVLVMYCSRRMLEVGLERLYACNTLSIMRRFAQEEAYARRNILHYGRQTRATDVLEGLWLWEWVMILLQAIHYHLYNDKNQDSTHTKTNNNSTLFATPTGTAATTTTAAAARFNPLHIAAQIPDFPPPLLILAMRAYPGEMRIPADRQTRNLPLHSVSSWCIPAGMSLCRKSISLTSLVADFPTAMDIPNADGFTPPQLEEQSGSVI